jgi:hypothetical protein
MIEDEDNELINLAVPDKSIPVAWLVLRPRGDGFVEQYIVTSPLTDDTVIGYGDEAWPLYVSAPN